MRIWTIFSTVSLVLIVSTPIVRAQVSALTPPALVGVGPLSAKSGTGGNVVTVPVNYTAGTYESPMLVLTYTPPPGGRPWVQFTNMDAQTNRDTISIPIAADFIIGEYMCSDFYFSDSGGNVRYHRDGSISRFGYTSPGQPTQHNFDLSALDFTVVAPQTPLSPTIAVQPHSVRVRTGDAASFTVVVSGSPLPVFQWRKNGSNIAGATSNTLTLPHVLTADAGWYDIVVTNAAGSVTSASAELIVDAGRMRNLSVRIVVPDDGVLIAGFVVETRKTVLIRGIGRSLEQFGVPVGSSMRDPRVEVYNAQGARVSDNDDFIATPQLVSATARSGAFALSSLKDSALLVTLEPGAYTVQVRSVDGVGGDCLVEVYDVD